MSFGTIPYKRYWYGNSTDIFRCTSDSAASRTLIECLNLAKTGDFSSNKYKLIDLLFNKSLDIRYYACQLFADTCRYNEISIFEDVFIKAETIAEIKKLILRIGETLSPKTSDLLINIGMEMDSSEITDYILDSLKTSYPHDLIDRNANDFIALKEVCKNYQKNIDLTLYYYEGLPIYAGDLTKQISTNSIIALKESTPMKSNLTIQILNNFTGELCPVHYGSAIHTKDYSDLILYIKKISGKSWKKGAKYFMGHEIK